MVVVVMTVVTDGGGCDDDSSRPSLADGALFVQYTISES